MARLFLQRFYFSSDFSDWVAGGMPEPLSQLEYCEEMAFVLRGNCFWAKAVERAGDPTGGREKGFASWVGCISFAVDETSHFIKFTLGMRATLRPPPRSHTRTRIFLHRPSRQHRPPSRLPPLHAHLTSPNGSVPELILPLRGSFRGGDVCGWEEKGSAGYGRVLF